jgi:hypothetical protein
MAAPGRVDRMGETMALISGGLMLVVDTIVTAMTR